MKTTLTVHAPNTLVTIAGGKEARIGSALINEYGVSYRVGYWRDDVWTEVYLPADEVTASEDAQTWRVRFHA